MTDRDEILHIAFADDWADAQQAGEYRMSTKGRTLDEQGFIHASFDRDQVERVGTAVYASEARPLVVLVVDVGALDSPVVAENLDGGDEPFPHVYGPIPARAVVATVPARAEAGRFVVDWEQRRSIG